MKTILRSFSKSYIPFFILMSCTLLVCAIAGADPVPLLITPLAEIKVTELPAGQLFWRIENFATLAEAKAVAGKWALATEAEGRVWLFTLGPVGGSSKGGTPVAEVGPISRVAASQYLLRVNLASGPPGSKTPVHSHPGSEAFFVLAGEQSIRSPHGVQRVEAGKPEPGHGPGMPMQVTSSGATDLKSLVMFVIDATKPFSSPAVFP